jgi:hypothetical protein
MHRCTRPLASFRMSLQCSSTGARAAALAAGRLPRGSSGSSSSSSSIACRGICGTGFGASSGGSSNSSLCRTRLPGVQQQQQLQLQQQQGLPPPVHVTPSLRVRVAAAGTACNSCSGRPSVGLSSSSSSTTGSTCRVQLPAAHAAQEQQRAVLAPRISGLVRRQTAVPAPLRATFASAGGDDDFLAQSKPQVGAASLSACLLMRLTCWCYTLNALL